jgi:hypothetical protein
MRASSVTALVLYSVLSVFSQTVLGQSNPGQGSNLIREEKVLRRTNGVLVIQVTEHQRPPFYRGEVPFIYVSAKKEFGSVSSVRVTLWNDFKSFRNDFELGSEDHVPGVGLSIPGSARSTNAQGKLLVEAHVVNLKKGQGFEIEEVHYHPAERLPSSARVPSTSVAAK